MNKKPLESIEQVKKEINDIITFHKNECDSIIQNMKMWYLEEKVKKKMKPQCNGRYPLPLHIENAKKMEHMSFSQIVKIIETIQNDSFVYFDGNKHIKLYMEKLVIDSKIIKQLESIINYRKEVPL